MKVTEILDIVSAALFGPGKPLEADWQLYAEMEKHAITALPAHILSSMDIPNDLLKDWKRAILKTVIHNEKYKHVQSTLPITVPYVILKGTAAAQYYPHPEYRTMGDIDVITRHEDYETACMQLLADGYMEVTNQTDRERKRHREFYKDGFSVEIHLFFVSMNDPVKAERFENYIIANINDTHALPHPVNGLVLLEHINQHLEEGLGLRQIIDWMMFVDHELPDDKWPVFQKMASETGLETLAVTVTRMCELALGLEKHDWCSGADERLCRQLLDYVLACGNFGQKRSAGDKLALGRAAKIRRPITMIQELQRMGLRNWKRADNKLLKPFAWIWQGCHLVRTTSGLVEHLGKSKQLESMLDKLGVQQLGKGLVYFENGKYIKKKH